MALWKKIVFALLIVLLLIPSVAFVAVQMPVVQTFLCSYVTETLNGTIKGKVDVGRIFIAPPHTVIVKDVCVEDSAGDTLLSAKKILVNIKPVSLLGDNLKAARVVVSDGQFSISHITPDKTNLSLFLEAFSSGEDKEETSFPFKSISLGRLSVKNFDFSALDRFQPCPHPESPSVIDWNNIEIDDICLAASDIVFSDSLSLDIRSFSFKERRGFDLERMSGRVRIGAAPAGSDVPMEIKISKLILDEGGSSLDMDYLSLGFSGFEDFSAFTDKVVLDGMFNDAVFNFGTLKSFAPGFEKNNLAVGISGRVRGPVCALVTNSLEVSSGDSRIHLNAIITGLPDINSTFFKVGIDNLISTSSGIDSTLTSIGTPVAEAGVSGYMRDDAVSLHGNVEGLLSNLLVRVELDASSSGHLSLDTKCSLLENGFRVSGLVDGKRIDLGRILSEPALGKMTFSADFNATIGSSISAGIEPLHIAEVEFKGYKYKDILATGSLDGGYIDGRLICNDSNLNLMAQGVVDLSADSGNRLCKANLTLGYADLQALHLYTSPCRVSLQAEADLTETSARDGSGGEGDVLGDFIVHNFNLESDQSKYHIGDITMKSYVADTLAVVRLRSSLFEADYTGSLSAASFVDNLLRAGLKDEFPNIFEGTRSSESVSEGRGDFRFKVGDLSPLTAVFLPKLYVGPGTGIAVNLHEGILNADVNSPLLAYDGAIVKDLHINVSNPQSTVVASVSSSLATIGTFTADDNDIRITLNDNCAGIRYSFLNGKEKENGATLEAEGFFPHTEDGSLAVEARFSPSVLKVQNVLWPIAPAYVRYAKNDIALDGFRLGDDEQYISIEGRASSSAEDTVRLSLHDFDIGIVNSIFTLPVSLGGVFNGNADIFALFGESKGFVADIGGNQITLNGEDIGTLSLNSIWDEREDNMDISLVNRKDSKRSLALEGAYVPRNKSLDMQVAFDSFKLSPLGPMVSDIVRDLDGRLSGKISMAGPLDSLSIRSKGTRLDSLSFVLDFTKVPYEVDGTFSVSEKGVDLGGLEIMDKYGHRGRLSGGVSYDCFKDIKLDTRIRIEDVLALNTTARDASSFYGRVFATGLVRLSGPLDDILLDVKAKTTHNSSINIPLGSAASDSKPLLVFVDSRPQVKVVSALDSLKALSAVKKAGAKESNFKVKLRVNATPDVQVALDINREMGDVLTARGNGQIDITVDKDLFDLRGAYNINEGKYKLVLMGLVSKDFKINSGGSVNFGGDIMNSDLNVNATYNTKASIGTLIADTTSLSNRRNVNCNINIGGKLSNPQISFDIDIPDLDPITNAKAENALNTEEKRLKQALALMISGGFIPDDESGVASSTSLLYSNAAEIISTQINKIFNQLDIPVDLGFNYQPDLYGRDMFDVAVSTQLFNNRVSINGNLGNKQYGSYGTNELVGDVDVEVKLTNGGEVRMTLFSHSTDDYSNYLDNYQRNGVGVIYQEEFDTFGELAKKMFWGKKRYEAFLQEQARERRRREAPSDSIVIHPGNSDDD